MEEQQKQQDDNNNDDQKIERSEDQVIAPQVKTIEVNVDYKDRWLRAQADYQNLQKEMAARRGEWAAMSEAMILEEFIPVYDNLKKALTTDLANTDSTDPSKQFLNWRKGIEFIKQQFWNVLKAHGIEQIETVGKAFDPKMHESVGEEEGIGEPHTILREVDAGYRKNGAVIKVAKVIVKN